MSSPVPTFDCKRCNTCCQGKGGIAFKPDQVGPAAAFLAMEPKVFIERFLKKEGELFQVLCDQEGKCRLLGPQGCLAHPVKPDICRRWPFFEALLSDPGAFEEAKLACPGLNPKATHEDFLALARREGY